MKKLIYAAALFVIACTFFLSACTGEINAISCSYDGDCPDGYYCAVSGGVFFASDVCALKMSALDGDTGGEIDLGRSVNQPKDADSNVSDVPQQPDLDGQELIDIVDEADALVDVDAVDDVDALDEVDVLDEVDALDDVNVVDDTDVEDIPQDPPVIVFQITPDTESLEMDVHFKFGCQDNANHNCSYQCRLENDRGFYEELKSCMSDYSVQLGAMPFGYYTLHVVATDINRRQVATSYSWNFNLGWKKVSAGDKQTCGVISNGALYCWGTEGINGYLGLGLSDGTTIRTPQRVGRANDWAEVATNLDHSCGIRTDGSLWCWGSNNDHQLGIHFSTRKSNVPVRVDAPEGTVWKSIALGAAHTCAIREDGSLWCWGANNKSQLGFSGELRYHVPQRIGSKSDWTGVSSVGDYTCAIKSDKSAQCWGDNAFGQLGLGDGASNPTTSPSALPQAKWISFSSGMRHSCGIKTNGTLWCWGEGRSGKLGLGQNATTREYREPTQVGPANDWHSVHVHKYHSCAVTKNNALWCWGNNNEGQLGLGDNGSIREAPEKLAFGSSEWGNVSVGGSHTCGINASGKLFCWGKGTLGQLGYGGANDQSKPYEVNVTP